MNKHFLELIEKSKAIHTKKAADYTTDPTSNPHENFTRGNEIASWFPNNHKSYAVLVATKLARLAALLTSGRTANNESLDDTFLDLLTYVALWYSYYKDSQYPQGLNPTGHWVNPNNLGSANMGLMGAQYNPSVAEQRKAKDSPDPTEPTPHCYHSRLNTVGRCVNCGIMPSDKDIANYYTKLPDRTFYLKK